MSRGGDERWSGHGGFILAAIGGAVGLGSIWKFPYTAGVNGGGAFIVLYLVGIAVIVLPLMLIEVAIGRRGRAGPADSLSEIAVAAGRSPRWRWIGAFGVLTGALILSFYSVIGGWTVAYAIDAIISGAANAEPAEVRRRFERHLADPLSMTIHHSLFSAATATIVAVGVTSGIELVCRWLMPLLIVMLIALAGVAMMYGDAAGAFGFMFAIDLERMTPRAAIDALGLGFFSIGVGLGFMVAYAAYAEPAIDLRKVVVVTILADTAISLISGLAIFPLVLAYGLDPASGPGLMFVTLPLAFARMPGGGIVAVAFYGLLAMAALASAIALLELVVAWLVRAARLSRPRATALAAAACWLAGLASVLSFNRWAGWHPAGGLPDFERATAFDLIDYATSNLMLPLGATLFAIFGGWIMPRAALSGELALHGRAFGVLRMALRYLLPVLIPALLIAPFVLHR